MSAIVSWKIEYPPPVSSRSSMLSPFRSKETGVVHRPTADESCQDLCFGNPVLWDLHDVVRQNHEVGELPGFDRSDSVLPEGDIGAVGRVNTERRWAREFLFRRAQFLAGNSVATGQRLPEGKDW